MHNDNRHDEWIINSIPVVLKGTLGACVVTFGIQSWFTWGHDFANGHGICISVKCSEPVLSHVFQMKFCVDEEVKHGKNLV